MGTVYNLKRKEIVGDQGLSPFFIQLKILLVPGLPGTGPGTGPRDSANKEERGRKKEGKGKKEGREGKRQAGLERAGAGLRRRNK